MLLVAVVELFFVAAVEGVVALVDGRGETAGLVNVTVRVSVPHPMRVAASTRATSIHRMSRPRSLAPADAAV